MLRLPGSTNLTPMKSAKEYKEDYLPTVRQWFQRAIISRRARAWMMNIYRSLPPPPTPTPDALTRERYEAFAEVLVDTPEGLWAVPEDKSPMETWLRTVAGHTLAMDDQCKASDWHETPLTVEMAEAASRTIIAQNTPGRFRFLVDRMWGWSKSCVPRCYLSVKKKCFSSFKKLCVKPVHACFRKIVSYSGLFGKKLLRRVHKGIQIALQEGGETWAAWDLKGAADSLRSDADETLPHPEDPFHCWKCGGERLPGMLLWVGDTGKFYEQFTVQEAVDGCSRMLGKVEKSTGHSTVTVVTSTRVRGHLGGRLTPYPPNRARLHVYAFSELLGFFECAIRLALVAVGETVLRIPHIPIGNPMGKIAVECLAGECERRWDQNELTARRG